MRVGIRGTSVCYTDITVDGLPDLVVAGDDCLVRVYRNTGVGGRPEFDEPILIRGEAGYFRLPNGCGSRIEIADWDGDGLKDIIAGEFAGFITFFKNRGAPGTPWFPKTGLRFSVQGKTFEQPYNTHPRVFDINQDGKPDLVYGINWAWCRALINTSGTGTTNFSFTLLLKNAAGGNLDIRSLNEDDTTPDFGDLNNDGVVDLISGGKWGKLFVMYGVAQSPSLSNQSSRRTNASPGSLTEHYASSRTNLERFREVVRKKDPCLALQIPDEKIRAVALRDIAISTDDLALLLHLSTESLLDTGIYRVALSRKNPYLAAFIKHGAISNATIKKLSMPLSSPVLRVRTSPVGGKVLLDGKEVGAGFYAAPIARGRHTVSFGEVAQYPCLSSQSYRAPGPMVIQVGEKDILLTGEYVASQAVNTGGNRPTPVSAGAAKGAFKR